MEIFERSVLEEWADHYNTRPVDEKQLELTDRILVPALTDIELQLLDLRKGFDTRIQDAIADEVRALAECGQDPLFARYVNDPCVRNPSEYPIGYCLDITDGVLEDIFLKLETPSTPGISALASFIGSGGHFKRISGIKDRKFFHNAMQAGDLVVDVANDTVDVSAPPVKISTLAESGFQNIDDLALYGDVAESYWGDTVYPQRVFPAIAHLFPIIRVSPSGMLQVDSLNDSIFARNILSGFNLAENFILRSPFTKRQLPAPYVKLIDDMFYRGTRKRNIFHRADADDDLILKAFNRVRGLCPSALYMSIGDGLATMEFINNAGISI